MLLTCGMVHPDLGLLPHSLSFLLGDSPDLNHCQISRLDFRLVPAVSHCHDNLPPSPAARESCGPVALLLSCFCPTLELHLHVWVKLSVTVLFRS